MADDFSMRARQLASSVRQGKKITVSILDEEQQEGYLAAMDKETIMILALDPYDRGFKKLLIPWTSILFVHLQDEKTFREDPLYDEMYPVVKSFQDYINKTYFQESNESPATGTPRRRSGTNR